MSTYQKQINELKATQREQKELLNQCFQQITWCKDTVKEMETYLDFNGTYDHTLTEKCLDTFFEIDKINKLIIALQRKVESL